MVSVRNTKGWLHRSGKLVHTYFSTGVTYFTEQPLYAIYTALGTGKSLWTKRATAQTNSGSEKKFR